MVAAALVITAAVVVIGAVLSASLTFVSVAAVLAVVLGAAAVRITHSELVDRLLGRADLGRHRRGEVALLARARLGDGAVALGLRGPVGRGLAT